MPARAIDTASISFGLVAIPIKIYSTSEPSHEIHFHLIHEGCGERLKQQYVCPRHGEVDRSEMAKGFELTKGNFVELSKDELKALEAVTSDEVSIREFVPAVAIDPIYVERTYFLGPGKGGERAYRLLRDALEHAELRRCRLVRGARQGVRRHGAAVRGWARDAPAALSRRDQVVERGAGRQAAQGRAVRARARAPDHRSAAPRHVRSEPVRRRGQGPRPQADRQEGEGRRDRRAARGAETGRHRSHGGAQGLARGTRQRRPPA